MKIRSIASATALVCLAAPAFALTPGQIDSSTVQLWINGATAPTAGVAAAVAKLCADEDGVAGPDDLHVYLEKTPANAADAFPGKSNAGKFAAYACTMGAGAGSLAGVKTVVYHTFDVGSFEAYTPHLYLAGEVNALVPATVKRLKNIATTAACVAHPTVANTYTGCGTDTVTVAPNADVFSLPTLPVGGISDTEYLLNQLNLGVSKSLGDIGSEVSTNVGQGFGVAVSYPLYVAMQTAQGLNAGGACAATGSGAAITAVNTTAACQPNITKQKYASLASVAAGDKNASLLGATGNITVERRVGTSGTQSASNAFFLNKPCGLGVTGAELGLEGLNTVGSVTLPGGVTIRSNNGSGDVKANLTAASSAGTNAIGVLSLENAASATEKFAYLKVNGASPTTDSKHRATAVAGDYEFWYEMVAFTAATAPSEGADLMNGLVTVLADPSVTDLRGLFVTPLSGFTGSSVSAGYKAGNACAPAVQ
jgi:hypothetical protein